MVLKRNDRLITSIREQYEQHQSSWLAPCAVREADSGGRTNAEAEHAYRTCFHRDRDRVVHCSAFRRLDFKTQVFVPHEQDHYRTRMTHTLEVAQIGRALRLNEDVIEAVALAHDLGHSPFGHAGESALNELMAAHAPEGQRHFEHNQQSLRVVDYLEHPYPAFRGLNLTRVVRECLAKHTTRYDTPLAGEFDTRELAPLEGQLVDLADEIAYTSADLEDALAVGWLTPEQLGELELWRRAWRTATGDCPGAGPIHLRIRACKAVLAMLADDAIATTAANIEAMKIDSPHAARLAPAKAAGFSAEVAAQAAQVQQFLMQHVYLHPTSAASAHRAKAMIGDLFGAYVADPSKMPPRYQRRIAADGLHRVACDYIAGMTDRYAAQQHLALAK